MDKVQKSMVSRISDTENDWLQRTRAKMQQRRKREKRILKGAVCGLLIGGAVLLCGYMSQQEVNRVETVYTVKPGDTLRYISEAYLEKETANKRYILRFEHDIKMLNPQLQDSVDIHPGDEIKIQYFTK